MNVVPSGNYDCGYNATAECDTLNDADNKWPKAFVLQFEERAFFGERDTCNLNPCYETGTSNLKRACNDFAGVDGNCADPGNCCTPDYPTSNDPGSMLRAEVFQVDKMRTVHMELSESESSLCEAVYYGTWDQGWEHKKTNPSSYKYDIDWPGGLHEIVRNQGGETGALTRTTRATITTTATTDGTYFYRTATLLADLSTVYYGTGDVLGGGACVGWRTPQDDKYRINTQVPCFCFTPDLLNTETLEMFDASLPCTTVSIGPDEPALPDALTTGIERTYNGLIPGGGYNSDAAITAWCESICTIGNACTVSKCCHNSGADCDDMTLQGCIDQGGTWYPDQLCADGVGDPCADPSGDQDCCGQCGCYRCHGADCTMSMTSCKTICKGSCYPLLAGSPSACPTGHDHVPRVHYSEAYGPWLDGVSVFPHQVGNAVSWGIGLAGPSCPATDWMAHGSTGLSWALAPSGHGVTGSTLLCQWVGYHCQAGSTGIDERRPEIVSIDWSA
jgi:hypothetical protein